MGQDVSRQTDKRVRLLIRPSANSLAAAVCSSLCLLSLETRKNDYDLCLAVKGVYDAVRAPAAVAGKRLSRNDSYIALHSKHCLCMSLRTSLERAQAS